MRPTGLLQPSLLHPQGNDSLSTCKNKQTKSYFFTKYSLTVIEFKCHKCPYSGPRERVQIVARNVLATGLSNQMTPYYGVAFGRILCTEMVTSLLKKKNTETLQFLIRETISNKQEPSFRQCMYLTLCSLMFISHLGQGHGCSLCQGEGHYLRYYIILCSLRAAISTL